MRNPGGRNAILGIALAGMTVAAGAFALQQRAKALDLRRQVTQLRAAAGAAPIKTVAVTHAAAKKSSALKAPVKAEVSGGENGGAARVAELERQVRELERKLAETPLPAPEWSPPRASNAMARVSFRDRLEQLKETDPERYQEIQRQREEFRQRVEDRIARQSLFLLDLDPDDMTEEEKINHKTLVATMEVAWKLFDAMQQGDADREARAEMREYMQALGEMFEVERNTVLKQYGKALGYDDRAAQEFSNAIRELVDITSTSRMFPGHGGHGPGGGMRNSETGGEAPRSH